MAQPDHVAHRLRTEPMTPIGQFTSASNATLLVWLGDKADLPPAPFDVEALPSERLAIYKPQRGEAPLWDFPDGTLFLREVAAAVLDRSLAWGMVPTTVRRDEGPFGAGMAQEFIPHEPEQHYFWLLQRDEPTIRRQLMQMVLFDIVANNTDRKGSHVLLAPDGHIRLIDHGVCFHRDPKLRTVAWDFAGDPIPTELRDEVGRVADVVHDSEELAELLTPQEVRTTARRARRVADDLVRFPEPMGPRPYPWPML